MLLPNIASMFQWVNNFFQGGPNTSQDFLQLKRQSDGTILGWIDETGTPRGSLASSAALVSPPFFYSNDLLGLPGSTIGGQISTTGAWISGEHTSGGYNSWGFLPGGNGAIGGFPFHLPSQLTTSDISVNVLNSDSTNQYDVGIYGPYTYAAGFVSVPLACHTGPKSYNSTGGFTFVWTSPATLAPGYYFLMFTTAGTTSLNLALTGSGGNSGNSFFGQPLIIVNGLIGSSVGSTLPNSISVSLQVQPLSIFAAQVNFTLS